MRKYLLPFISILLIAAFLRLYRLGEIPNGLYQDETAIGYNAYSLLETGKDEHGMPYPLYFASFGDQKLPVYVYATAVSVKLFGLTPFAVRLPSAVFGILTVALMYFLVYELTRRRGLSLLSTAILAVNPWHLHYTRATFEVSIGLFLFMAGAWCFIQGFRGRPGRLWLGAVLFLAGLYTYNLTRLLAPLLAVFSLLWLGRHGKPQRRELILTGLTAILLLLPLALTLRSAGGAASAKGTLLMSSAVVQAGLIEVRSYANGLPSLLPQLFFNSVFLNLWQYLRNILSYLSVPFFFINGSAHGNHGIQLIGQFHLVEIFLLIAGIAIWLRERKPWMGYLAGWALLSVMVAALTREAPHATRSFFLLFPLVVCIATGYEALFNVIRNRPTWLRNCLLGLTALIAVASGFYYAVSYYLRFPVVYAPAWRSQDKELAVSILTSSVAYDRIIVDPAAGIPYTSVLFYLHVPPADFLKTVERYPADEEGFTLVKKFGRFEFRPIDWSRDTQTPGTLIVTTPDNKPAHVPPLKTVYYPRKHVVFAVKQTVVQYPVEDIAFVLVSIPPK